MMDDLIAWLRAVWDENETVLRRWMATDSDAEEWLRLWLAEIDAKRRIISLIENGDGGTTHDECMQSAGYQVLCLLALPHADRPGYRDEWRPEP